MKSIRQLAITLIALSLPLAANNALAADQPVEKEIVIAVNDAYLPGGFDSSSDVFVVINGLFPNGCYRWARADVTHPEKTIHEVKSIAKVSQGMCLMVLVPFTKEVHVGQIGAGEHKIRLMNGDGTYLEKTLKIEE